jgi:zinc/manganese transport system ATP-binding protein
MDIRPGEILAVLGANGSGKSTFIKLLLGLHKQLSGDVRWPDGRPQEIGYLAQMTEFDRRFPLRVRDLVAMGAWRRLGWRGQFGPHLHRQVDAALEAAGVGDIAQQSLHTLSGGQLQRTLFARVILQDAPLILLDEPFAAVDQTTETHLLTLIERWREEGRAVVMVVHDLSSVLDHCDEVLLLGNGKAAHGAVATTLTPERLVDQNYLSARQADWMFRKSASQQGRAHV